MKKIFLLSLISIVSLKSSADSALLSWAKQGFEAGKKNTVALLKPCSVFVADAALSFYSKLPTKEVAAQVVKETLIKVIDDDQWAPLIGGGLGVTAAAAPLIVEFKSYLQGDCDYTRREKIIAAFENVSLPCVTGLIGLLLGVCIHRDLYPANELYHYQKMFYI